MYKALSKIGLHETIGMTREEIGISTVIATEDIHMEADFSAGRIGDAFIFKKTKKVDGVGGVWKFVVGIPASNLKSYDLVEPVERQIPSAESQTTNPSPAARRP